MYFTEKSFNVFNETDLASRMAAIRAEVQPIFQRLGTQAVSFFDQTLNENFYLHIAQHRRRLVHPPDETWAGIAPNRRGYKMDAHFQIGINPEYVFIWLSVIDQPKKQAEIAQRWMANRMLFEELPETFSLSKDHTKTAFESIQRYPQALERFATIKKSELQVGRLFLREDIASFSAEAMLETYQKLLPLYRLATT